MGGDLFAGFAKNLAGKQLHAPLRADRFGIVRHVLGRAVSNASNRTSGGRLTATRARCSSPLPKANPRDVKNLVKHRLGQNAGKRVLLAGMVAPQQPMATGQADFCGMAKLGRRSGVPAATASFSPDP